MSADQWDFSFIKRNKTKYFPLRQSEKFNNITERQTHRVTSWASCQSQKQNLKRVVTSYDVQLLRSRLSPLWLWWWVNWEWYLVKKFPCLTLCLYVYYIKYCIPSKVFEHLSKLWQFRDDGKVDEHHKIHFLSSLINYILIYWNFERKIKEWSD